MPPVTGCYSLGHCSNFDFIIFDQNVGIDHLHSTSPEGKDLSSDTQIRVIGSMEPEICTKMLSTLSEKLIANFFN